MVLKVGNNVKQASLSAIITRADGTVEDMGVIGYTSKNWFKSFFVNFWIAMKRRIKG